MSETVLAFLKLYLPLFLAGFVIGLLYFYSMRYSIRIAVQRKHALGWLVVSTLLRLGGIAVILFVLVQQGPGRLILFLVGFTVARFLLVSVAVHETEGSRHLV